ncbi:MAG: DUF3426 domain-containing protein [Smithellaceae bacterium]|nr:DUF3426 domain-containing protein [Syntrophaceae bacterium]MDD4240321.1 DUF3426 domain-containing protein [Smithellaceae bacterium]
MDNKIDIFDLKREKQELDAFLSTIVETESSASPVKGAVSSRDFLSSAEDGPVPSDAGRHSPAGPADASYGIRESAAAKPRPPAPNVNEFLPRLGDLDLREEPESRLEKASRSSETGETKKTEDLPRIPVSPAVKPLESLKTMTRFDGTTKAGNALDEISTPEEKKPSDAVETERKTGPQDFAPEKKGGKGKWVLAVLIVILLLIGGYLWLFSMKMAPGPADLLKTSIGSSLSSANEINLYNVRQRLVYNGKLGKSIRVIEGIAENTASYPVSRIKIAAKVYGADGALLGTMESFGGNILVDSKLENMDAAALIAELHQGKASEDPIPPKGQIPFMVVFIDETAGVYKLSVVPVAFTKH